MNNINIIAAQACIESYNKNIDLGSAEYSLTETVYNGEPLQVLAMPGTNEVLDWFWNFTLYSKEGVKRCTYLAVDKVYEAVKHRLNPDVRLLVTGHSKAGPDALWYQYKYGSDYCVAFCPAPGFRRWRVEEMGFLDATIFIDPDDIVPNMGKINFTHPKCKRVLLPRDRKWYNPKRFIEEHEMEHMLDYLLNPSRDTNSIK